MRRTIENVLEQRVMPYSGETNLNITLRSSTFSDGEVFKRVIKNRLENNDSELPALSTYGEVQVIDKETIIEINNTTTLEIRQEFMETVLNQTNSVANRAFLLVNSPEQVVVYVRNLIMRNFSNEMVAENELYPIGNILMYTISNVVGVGNIREILDSLNDSMFLYNNTKMFAALSSPVMELQQETQEIMTTSIQESRIRVEESIQEARQSGLRTVGLLQEETVAANQLITETGFLNQEEMQQRTNDFQKKLEERIEADRVASRNRALMLGGGFLANMMLSSVGLAPVGVVGLALRGLSSASQHLGLFQPSVVESQGISEILKAIPDFFS